MIARDGGGVEQSHGVLRQRRGADQPQPWIELAAPKSSKRDGHPGRIQGMVAKDSAGPVSQRDLPDEASQKFAIKSSLDACRAA